MELYFTHLPSVRALPDSAKYRCERNISIKAVWNKKCVIEYPIPATQNRIVDQNVTPM
eukprot:CAMPEP_0204893730 /NCGR_PEP_ID=MMETSP1349-20130617/32182_1 /ASSEMBLY_ACC=CAM_ASM_000710 /TAXON_ID=215587 /ORGANISM="Aplanochytrium stocchinoi, Strain GSBS06" /LENGTH=57 /DNA_ID=CAMNT_0052060513 /DNA_START=609 /DNA_END=779 /DNA_ORIENTATION=+